MKVLFGRKYQPEMIWMSARKIECDKCGLQKDCIVFDNSDGEYNPIELCIECLLFIINA